MDPLTHQELDCGSGPSRRDCPSNSYCHHTSKFARCCSKGIYVWLFRSDENFPFSYRRARVDQARIFVNELYRGNFTSVRVFLDVGLYLKSCKDSWYGCCPDNKTPAQGPDNAGCPSMCNCNKLGKIEIRCALLGESSSVSNIVLLFALGSYSDACDAETGQCKCKPGVGGAKCDRCEPGYWGLPKISSGHPGCLRKWLFHSQPLECTNRFNAESLFSTQIEPCMNLNRVSIALMGISIEKCQLQVVNLTYTKGKTECTSC